MHHRGGSGKAPDIGLKEKHSGNTILDLLRKYGRGELSQLIIGSAAAFVSRILQVVPAFILGLSIDAIFSDTRSFILPFFPSSWIPTTPSGQLWFAAGIIAGTYLLGSIIAWVNNWAWNHFAQHVQHRVRTDTYDRMQELEMSFFDDYQRGQLMSVLNNDVNRLERFLTRGLNMGINIAVSVGAMALMMFWLNWQLALITVVAIPCLAAASYKFMRAIQPKYRKVRRVVGSLNSLLENNLGGIQIIKAFNREDFESDRVEDNSSDYLDANWDAISTRIKFFPGLRVIMALGFISTFLIGGIWIISGPPLFFTIPLTAGTLVTFLMYSRRTLFPMAQFGRIVNDLEYARAACARIMGLMNRSPLVEEADPAVDLEDIEGRAEFDSVKFSYDSGETDDRGDSEGALRGVSFTAEPGKTVGLVGPTGSGKTTVARLLLRLYDVDDGEIRVDGKNIKDVSLSSLRKSIGYVSQDPFLFYGTIRKNIQYGSLDATEQEIERVAGLAGVEEFVSELSEGYSTEVGERGVKLSGGQRQRISLARAILKDPEILVLDEATSHVDSETEALIKERLEDFTADRTNIVIAHRLSTVRDADEIVVLESGKVIEKGTHEQLLDEKGIYAGLWNVQIGNIDESFQKIRSKY